MMILSGKNSRVRTASKLYAATAFFFASACGQGSDDSALNDDGAKNEDTPAVAEDRDASPEEPPSGIPVREANDNSGIEEDRTAGYYRTAWSGDNGVCNDVVNALNQADEVADGAGDYADAQAQQALRTARNVKWTTSEAERELAKLDYFNDGVVRTVERRRGMLSGNRIIALWIEDGEGGFARLELGHAGANTAQLIEVDNLHTKLTYSVVDVVDIGNAYLTLVSPLRDIDPSGAIFAINWRAKDGTASSREWRDYYPYVSCVIAPAEENR